MSFFRQIGLAKSLKLSNQLHSLCTLLQPVQLFELHYSDRVASLMRDIEDMKLQLLGLVVIEGD